MITTIELCNDTVTDDAGITYVCGLTEMHQHEHVDLHGRAWWAKKFGDGAEEKFNLYERLFSSINDIERTQPLVEAVEFATEGLAFDHLSEEEQEAFVAFVDLIANEVRGRVEVRAQPATEGTP